MFLIRDPKKAATTIIVATSAPEMHEEDDKEIVAESILKAIENKDKMALSMALKDFIYLCMDKDDRDEEMSSEMSHEESY
jgi:hypothetical protein